MVEHKVNLILEIVPNMDEDSDLISLDFSLRSKLLEMVNERDIKSFELDFEY